MAREDDGDRPADEVLGVLEADEGVGGSQSRQLDVALVERAGVDAGVRDGARRRVRPTRGTPREGDGPVAEDVGRESLGVARDEIDVLGRTEPGLDVDEAEVPGNLQTWG